MKFYNPPLSRGEMSTWSCEAISVLARGVFKIAETDSKFTPTIKSIQRTMRHCGELHSFDVVTEFPVGLKIRSQFMSG